MIERKELWKFKEGHTIYCGFKKYEKNFKKIEKKLLTTLSKGAILNFVVGEINKKPAAEKTDEP